MINLDQNSITGTESLAAIIDDIDGLALIKLEDKTLDPYTVWQGKSMNAYSIKSALIRIKEARQIRLYVNLVGLPTWIQ